MGGDCGGKGSHRFFPAEFRDILPHFPEPYPYVAQADQTESGVQAGYQAQYQRNQT